MLEVEHYGEVLGELRRAKRWDTPVEVLRLASLSLLSFELEGLGRALEDTAARLRIGAGWMDPLRGHLRHAVAAAALRADVAPDELTTSVAEVRAGLRQRKLGRTGAPETLAAVVLALHASGGTVSADTLDAMAECLARWKLEHPWLSGRDDYPMAAFHAAAGACPEALNTRIETLFEGLERSGVAGNAHLQQAAQLLAASPESEDALVHRFLAIRHRAEQCGLPTRGAAMGELALLALGPGHAVTLVERTAELTAGLRATRQRPSKALASTLAIGLVLATDEDGAPLVEAGLVNNLHAILVAHQAQLIAGTTAMAALAATAA